ncbi:MAG: hypothetical protein K9G36_01655 [Crocinitomicaceae bacterium]|nr:hypothetical protein [Crocinitomicaceae bacterium]
MNKYFIIGFIFVIKFASAQSKKQQIEILNGLVDSLNQIVSSRDNTISERNTQVNALNSTKATLESTISSLNINISKLTAEIQACTSDTKIKKEEIVILKSQLKVKTDSLASFLNFSEIEYQPTKNRFQNLQESRTLFINNQPLSLNPFEMFDIMTFKDIGTGLYTDLIFTIPETDEEFYFSDVLQQFTYNGNFNDQLLWTGNQAIVSLEVGFVEERLVRTLQKNKKYKVIYGYFNDSKLWRKPFPTESTDGYYIIDVIEMFDQFEREKL